MSLCSLALWLVVISLCSVGTHLVMSLRSLSHVSSLSIFIYLFPLYLYIPAYTCILQLSFFECVYVRECVRVLVCVCVFVSMRAYVLVLV